MNRPYTLLATLLLSLGAIMPSWAQTAKRNHGGDLSLSIGRRNADSTRTRTVELGITGAADTLRGVSVQAIASGYGVARRAALGHQQLRLSPAWRAGGGFL